ncbi:hypothetical protein NUSPORA_00677 [Nucleospora cyclopteri]
MFSMDSIKQLMIDKLSPQSTIRWGMFAFLIFLYTMRVLIRNSHHIISYAVGVYLVHGFILFATPKNKNIPDPFEAPAEDSYVPENAPVDFGPFVRNLPEYEYWLFCMKVVGISYFLTFFDVFDIPVFTPLLIMYFITMVIATIVKLYQHQKLYHYNPWQTIKKFKNKNFD